MVILVCAMIINVPMVMTVIMMSSEGIKITFILVVITMHEEGRVEVTLDVGRHLEEAEETH